jgi:hypothetical protein
VLVSGVGVSLEADGLPSVLSNNIGIDALHVDAARGAFRLKLGAPILDLPVTMEGALGEGVTRARVLGLFDFDVSGL